AQLGHSSPLDATVILLSPLSLPDALPIFGQFPANRSPVAAAPRAGSSLLRWSRRNQPSVDSHITSIGLRASTTWACRSGEPHHAPPSPRARGGQPSPARGRVAHGIQLLARRRTTRIARPERLPGADRLPRPVRARKVRRPP